MLRVVNWLRIISMMYKAVLQKEQQPHVRALAAVGCHSILHVCTGTTRVGKINHQYWALSCLGQTGRAHQLLSLPAITRFSRRLGGAYHSSSLGRADTKTSRRSRSSVTTLSLTNKISAPWAIFWASLAPPEVRMCDVTELGLISVRIKI